MEQFSKPIYLIFVIFIIHLQSQSANGAVTEKYVPNTRNNNRINRDRPPLILYEDPADAEEDVTEGGGGSLLFDARLNGGGDAFNDSIDSGEKKLTCSACDGPHCEVVYSCENAVMCWSSRHRDSYGFERFSKGCVNTRDRIPFTCNSRSHSKTSKQAHNASNPDYEYVAGYSTICCQTGDYCNRGEFPELPEPRQAEPQPTEDYDSAIIYIALGFTLAFFAAILVVTIKFVRRTHKKRMEELMKAHRENFYPLNDEELQAKSAGDSTLKEYLDGSMTSGSGSGLPLLIQRTLAKNIQLVECIGKGRFGEVWRAVWNCENVAVKIFATRDEASWIRETGIYSTVMLRHNNILGFYGSDMTSRNSVTQLWLVTHYHKCGSLYDYLNKKTIVHEQLFKLAYSLANGLAFLHSGMVGTESRPGIAHRDLKSKNILVSCNETCVIADFGMAVMSVRGERGVDTVPNIKQGTTRYMPPEMLDDTMKLQWFDAYKQADMYSFALILWEISRRCVTDAGDDKLECEDYNIPYNGSVPSDPSFEDMRKIVCEDGSRPEIPLRWNNSKLLRELAKIMKECWHRSPQVRLTSLRVKKTLSELRDYNYEPNNANPQIV